MARISNLTIDLSANDRKLRTDLRRAQREWRRYSRAVVRDMRGIATSITRGAGLAGAALVALAASSLRSADEIAKAARNAGFASAEYQRLAHVFELSGSSSEALTKASQALARQILELGQGTATQVEAFQRLGLSYQDLERLSPAEQFRVVIDRLRGVTNETDRTALAQEILGRAGKELGTVFATTSEQVLAMENRITSLGGVLSNEATAAAEAFNDEISVLTTVLRTQFTEGLLQGVGPAQNWGSAIRAAGEAAREIGTILPRVGRFVVEFRKEITIAVGAFVAWRLALVGAAFLGALLTAGKAIVALTKILRALTLAQVLAAAGPIALVAAIAGIGLVVEVARRAVVTHFDAIIAVVRNTGQKIAAIWDRSLAQVKRITIVAALGVIDAFDSVQRFFGIDPFDLSGVQENLVALGNIYTDEIDSAVTRLQDLRQEGQGLRDDLPEVGASIKQAFSELGDFATGIWDRTGGQLTERIRDALALGGDAGAAELEAAVGGALDNIANNVTETVTGAIGDLGNADAPFAGRSRGRGGPTAEEIAQALLPPPDALADTLHQYAIAARNGLQEALTEAIKTGDFSSVGGAVVDSIRDLFARTVATRIANEFQKVLDAGIDATLDVFGGGLRRMFTLTDDWIGDTGDALARGTGNMIRTFGTWLRDMGGGLVNGTVSMFSTFANWLRNLGGSLLAGTGSMLSTFLNWLQNLGGSLLDGTGNMLSTFLGWLQNLGGALGDGTGNMLTTFVNWLSNLGGGLSSGTSGMLATFSGWLSSLSGLLSSGVNALTSIFSGWLSGLGNLLSSGFSALLNGLGGLLSSGFGSILGSIGGLFGGVAAGTAINDGTTGLGSVVGTGIGYAVAGPIGGFIGGAIGGFVDSLFHEGGIVGGPRGSDQLIVAQAGEAVLNERQQAALANRLAGGGGVTVNLQVVGDVTQQTRRAVREMGEEVANIVYRNFQSRAVLA